jgi:spermidine synthase
VIIARAGTTAGEVVLRRRDGVTELVVNGVFAMDSAEVASELALADAAGGPPGRVLVGGLGLGYTVVRLLDAGAELVRVVELAEPLLDWARDGLTEQLGRVAADPRVQLVAGDIADAITPGWDAILLDVDNGPSFLIHDHNRRVYSEDFLRTCFRALNPGGRLVVWCETASPELATTLGRVAGRAELISVPVTRQGRSFDYALYRVVRSAQAAGSSGTPGNSAGG